MLRARTSLWPQRLAVPLGAGAFAAVALLAVELARRPGFIQTSTAFVASSAFGPMVLSLVVGMVVALRLSPTDLALGRATYLRLAGIGPGRLASRSLLRSCRDAGLATATLVVVAATAAAIVLPAEPIDARYLPWSFANEQPVLAEAVVWAWMAAAACLVASLVHVGAHLGANRVVTGGLTPLIPILVGLVPVDGVGRTVEGMFSPAAWSAQHSVGWWAVAGGAVLWAGSAMIAGMGAVLVARRAQR